MGSKTSLRKENKSTTREYKIREYKDEKMNEISIRNELKNKPEKGE